jgi:hypothetical protein
MSQHKIPLTELEREGLVKHGFEKYIGKPSQLVDVFRSGVAWALSKQAIPEVVQWQTRMTPVSGWIPLDSESEAEFCSVGRGWEVRALTDASSITGKPVFPRRSEIEDLLEDKDDRKL